MTDKRSSAEIINSLLDDLFEKETKNRIKQHDINVGLCEDCPDYGYNPLKKALSAIKGLFQRRPKKNYVAFAEIYPPDLLELLTPKYPRIEKKLIKRKYGKYPAIYLDVWKFYPPGLFDFLPKHKWRGHDWRVKPFDPVGNIGDIR